MSPAHAGMDLSRRDRAQLFPPHTRGWTFCRVHLFPAHGWTTTSGTFDDLFPPHTRGWTQERAGQEKTRAFPPQLNIVRFPPMRGWTDSPAHRSFPRTRGDGPFDEADMPKFSPAHAGMDPCTVGAAVSPAHAGMDPVLWAQEQCPLPHRGVSPAHAGMDRFWTTCPAKLPRTREDPDL